MMKQEQIIDEFSELIEVFKQKGCSLDQALSFIYNNFDFVIDKYEEFSQNIYFIYNHSCLYGILVAKGDFYEWSIYDNGKFNQLMQVNGLNNGDKGADYIVEMMINFANMDKIKKIVPEVISMNVENRIKMLKRIGLNSNGYHFR